MFIQFEMEHFTKRFQFEDFDWPTISGSQKWPYKRTLHKNRWCGGDALSSKRGGSEFTIYNGN